MCRTRPSSSSRWRFSACTNTSRTSRAALPSLAPSRLRPIIISARANLTKITDMPKLFPMVNSKPDAELFADLDATVAWAKSQGGDTNKLGIMGFCRGGRTVWDYSAHNPNLKAGVAFYGSLVDRGATDCRRADRACARREGAGARPLRRSRCRASRSSRSRKWKRR